MRPRCLAERMFGAGTSAPSMARASVVAETGSAGRDDGAAAIARWWTLFGPARRARSVPCESETTRAHACAALSRQLRHDARPELRARSEHAMEARQRVARRRHERAKPRDALHGRHDPAARRAPRRLLHAVGDAPVAQDAKARERKRRTKAVAAKPLSAEVIVGGDGEARVQVEAMARDGFVDKRGRGLGGAFALARVVLDVLDGAALRGDLGEHLGEGALGRVVRRVVVFLRVPALAKPRHHPERHALGEDVELRAARRGRGHEARRVPSSPST